MFCIMESIISYLSCLNTLTALSWKVAIFVTVICYWIDYELNISILNSNFELN